MTGVFLAAAAGIVIGYYLGRTALTKHIAVYRAEIAQLHAQNDDLIAILSRRTKLDAPGMMTVRADMGRARTMEEISDAVGATMAARNLRR